MEARRKIYSRFIAPWNLEKITDLSGFDDEIKGMWKSIQYLINKAEGERDNYSERLDAALENVIGFKNKFEMTERNLQKLNAEYEQMHHAYEQLCHQLESQDGLKMQIAALKVELETVKHESGKKRKKSQPKS
jgi:chromosome segregation ATPase